jgi:hypothetical protein
MSNVQLYRRAHMNPTVSLLSDRVVLRHLLCDHWLHPTILPRQLSASIYNSFSASETHAKGQETATDTSIDIVIKSEMWVSWRRGFIHFVTANATILRILNKTEYCHTIVNCPIGSEAMISLIVFANSDPSSVPDFTKDA